MFYSKMCFDTLAPSHAKHFALLRMTQEVEQGVRERCRVPRRDHKSCNAILYYLFGPASTRTSVRPVPGSPSRGSIIVSVGIASAACQAGSSSTLNAPTEAHSSTWRLKVNWAPAMASRAIP